MEGFVQIRDSRGATDPWLTRLVETWSWSRPGRDVESPLGISGLLPKKRTRHQEAPLDQGQRWRTWGALGRRGWVGLTLGGEAGQPLVSWQPAWQICGLTPLTTRAGHSRNAKEGRIRRSD